LKVPLDVRMGKRRIPPDNRSARFELSKYAVASPVAGSPLVLLLTLLPR
jgi:hypothetical protein